MTNTILAIDPGYDRCGVAVFVDGVLAYSNCIETSKSDTHSTRLAHIYTKLAHALEAWHPSHIALETLFFSVNKTSALKVAEARGVVLLLAGLHNIPLIELSPQEVKQSLTGVGNADKQQVQKMSSLILGVDTSGKLDDEIDAIALGIAALGKLKLDLLAKKNSI